MKVDYVDHMGNDLTVANAARVSFNKHKEEFGEDDERLIRYLANHGHWTPFGHPCITLRVKAPVFIRTQCFKHKVGFTENEVSRRYVDDRVEFFQPVEFRGRPRDGAKQGSSKETVSKIWDEGQEWDVAFLVEQEAQYCRDLYELLICGGVAPEQARMVLPQSMYTEWYWTGSLAAYARFYNLRSDPHAQVEIQELAEMVADHIDPLFPISWRELTCKSKNYTLSEASETSASPNSQSD